MIERLDIEGFGVNKKLSLEFGQYVTTIIGKSYEGKSWALRGLKCVMTNNPAGLSCINWDLDKYKIRLFIDPALAEIPDNLFEKKTDEAGAYLVKPPDDAGVKGENDCRLVMLHARENDFCCLIGIDDKLGFFRGAYFRLIDVYGLDVVVDRCVHEAWADEVYFDAQVSRFNA